MIEKILTYLGIVIITGLLTFMIVCAVHFRSDDDKRIFNEGYNLSKKVPVIANPYINTPLWAKVWLDGWVAGQEVKE